VQKRRRKTFGNSDEAASQLSGGKKTAVTPEGLEAEMMEDEEEDMDENSDSSVDGSDDDPDWVSGQTPGGPGRASTLRAKVSFSLTLILVMGRHSENSRRQMHHCALCSHSPGGDNFTCGVVRFCA